MLATRQSRMCVMDGSLRRHYRATPHGLDLGRGEPDAAGEKQQGGIPIKPGIHIVSGSQTGSY